MVDFGVSPKRLVTPPRLAPVVLRPDMQTFALDTGDLGFALSNPRHVWPLLGTVSEVTF